MYKRSIKQLFLYLVPKSTLLSIIVHKINKQYTNTSTKKLKSIHYQDKSDHLIDEYSKNWTNMLFIEILYKPIIFTLSQSTAMLRVNKTDN